MTINIHVSRDLLRAAYERDDSAALIRLLAVSHEHLASLCPRCAEEIAAFSKSRSSAVPFLQTFETVTQALNTLGPLVEEETASVTAFVETLQELPAEQRWSRIVDREDLHDLPLLSALLAESRSNTPGNPCEALVWAQLAESLLCHRDLGPEAQEHWVRSVAYQANAHRLRNQLRLAEQELSRSRHLVHSLGVSDPAVTAELDSLHASLLIELQQLDRARRLLHRAAFLFKSIGADDQVGRVLIQLGIAHEYDADPVTALEVTHEALAYLDPERHRHLFLCAMLSIARYHYAQGEYETALDIATFDEDLIEAEIASGNTSLDYNLRWLHGRIAAAREEFAQAEKYLSSIRREAIERADAYDAIVVNMELALLHYRCHRRDEALVQAGEALNLARAHRLPHHATTALVLLADTLRQGEPAAQLLHQVAELVQKARLKPSEPR